MMNKHFYLFSILFFSIPDLSSAKTETTASNKAVLTLKASEQKSVLIKGKVSDGSNGQSLPGVSILVKGTELGTITDADGKFSINAEENATLVFSYIGFDPVELPVKEETNVTVEMKPTAKNLTEVVVVGYGTQKKTSLTAAVSTISSKDIAMKPVVNLGNALGGRAAGLIVTQGSGEPGFDQASILIRGSGSVGSTQPLLIVDGVPRDFSRLDPSSIATMSILKDAAAVAPYGVAGANGVILVTTKQGKAGKASISYNGYVGFQNPTRVPEFVNSYQYALMRNAANANDGTAPAFNAQQIQKFLDHSDPDAYGDSQPLKEVIKPNQLLTYHNLTLSGGSETFKYFVSLAYTRQNGMWSSSYGDKFNATSNLSINATKTTTVNLNFNTLIDNRHFPTKNASDIINQAQRQTPDIPVYFSNGLWSGYIAQSLIGEIYHSGSAFNQLTTTNSQISINQQLPIKGLALKGVLSYDLGPDPLFGNQNSLKKQYIAPIPFWEINKNTHEFSKGIQGNTKPQLKEEYHTNRAITYQGILNYNTSFGQSNVGFTGVIESRNVNYHYFIATRTNFSLDIDELSLGGPAATDATNSGSSQYQKQLGYVYRANYGYARKYLVEASGRYDGSYMFAPGKRFGFFPSFSGGWVLSEENFIKNNFKWIDYIKVRGSWGVSGAYPSRDGSLRTGEYLDAYTINGTSAVINGSTTLGIAESLQGNPNITWERGYKSNIGFEATFWNGAFSLEADYFVDKRANMLVPNTTILPAEYGINIGLVNAGKMINKGFEFTLRSSHNFTNGLKFDATGTFTYAQNKLLDVFETASTFNNTNRRQTGRPLGTQFGYQALGYFKTEDFNENGTLKAGIPTPTFGVVRPGDLQYADLNNDGVINANDQTVIGRRQTPGIIYGLEPRLSYKNFDLSLLFQGTANANIFLNGYAAWPFLDSGSATVYAYNNYWTPERTDAPYPRLSNTPTNNNKQTSSWWIRNNAYVRLKSFEVGYTFSGKLLRNSLQALRLYVAGQNVFTWTPYIKETIDPENSSNNQSYFQQRVLSVGVNVTF